MGLRADGSLALQTPLSMSRVADAERPVDADIVRFVELTLGGDTAAFEHIVLRYETRVMTVAVRLLGTRDDARDAAQEVFLRAFKYLHRLDLRKPVEPWLLRITVNVCRDVARLRNRRHATFVGGDDLETIDESPDQHARLTHTQERRLLQRALDELPEMERLAIVLRDVEGLSTFEVAGILQSSETTVRSQISRGRLRLKAAVDRLIGGQS